MFFRIPINWTSFATGGVILVAVAADTALRRYRASRIPSPGTGPTEPGVPHRSRP